MATVASYSIKKTAITGTPNIRLYSTSTGTNWGATLVADNNDFTSTSEFNHGDNEMSGTGWVELPMTAANVNTNGVNYIRLLDRNAGNHNNENITIASTNNATAGDRPYLKLKVTSSTVVKDIIGMGVIAFPR